MLKISRSPDHGAAGPRPRNTNNYDCRNRAKRVSKHIVFSGLAGTAVKIRHQKSALVRGRPVLSRENESLRHKRLKTKEIFYDARVPAVSFFVFFTVFCVFFYIYVGIKAGSYIFVER
jgi:hypothetical protein